MRGRRGACLSIWLWVAASAVGVGREVRVGIFPVDPLNFMDGDGVAQGLNPDLLREISSERGEWVPQFVPVTWAEGLEKLQTEELDLMVSVTYTKNRAEVMDFSAESVLEVWGQVFVRQGSGLESVLDLEGRRVGVMDADINGKNFIKLASAFGIDYELTKYATLQEVFEALARGEVDAGVTPSHFGLRHARQYHVVGTSIQFSPAPVFFAAKKGRMGDVLGDIDTVMAEWKSDEHSFYYQRYKYWFGGNVPLAWRVPVWIWIALGSTVMGMALLIALSWLFKQQVKARTAALAESEERYRMLVENHSDLVVKVDVAGRLLYVSPSYCDLFGKSEESLLGQAFMPLVHEEDRASTKEAMKALYEPPHEAYLEQRALTKHGWRWLSWQDSAILNERGEVVEIIGMGRDITDRKDAQRAYRESADRLRLATAAAQVGIWEYDFQHDKLIWDDQMFNLYGVARGRFGGVYKDWQNTLHPDDLYPAEREFSKAISSHETFDTEFRVVWQTDGSIHHLRALAEVEYGEDGNPIRAVGTNWDVTRHHQMVNALTSSERAYRQLFENMTTGFMLFEVVRDESGAPVDYLFAQLNEAAEKITGRPRSQLLRRSLLEVFAPLEERWVRGLQRVATTGQGVAIEDQVSALGKYLSVWMFAPRPGHVGIVVSDNTARRLAEEEVLRAREQLKHIIDSTIDVIFQLDAKGNYIFTNSAIEALTGYDEKEILGMNVLEVVDPQYHEAVGERFQRRTDGEELSETFTFEINRKDGEKRWVELVSRAIWDEEGKLEGVQGVARDATFRVEAEREIDESRRFLRTIIDTIPARVFWKDLNSIFLGCNVAFAEDSGFAGPDQLVGKDDFEMSWGDTEAEVYRADDQWVIQSGESRINFEERQTRPNGEKVWLSTSKVPIRDARGEVIGVLGAYQDITERKLLEEDRDRLSTAINQSAEAVVVLNQQGRVTYVNPSLEIVTGLRREEVLGESLGIFYTNAHDEELRHSVKQAMERGERWSGRLTNPRPDGSMVTVDATLSPVKDELGHIVNHVVTIHDVSRQVELEEHMRQAQKMDAVGRLAGGVAHDFNNILQSILGFSGMLINEMGAESPHVADVEEIRKAARRAGDLTRQLLTLSRKRDVEYTVQNLNAMVRRNESMLRRLIGENIKLTMRLGDDLKPVRADASQLEQIMLNLVINGRDAMPHGGELRARTSMSDENTVCLSVEDTGYGIRDDVREHLFEPFFTTKKVGEGTGLGLSVVYGIVQAHGGRIEVSSVVGEGSEFRVYFPAHDRCDIEPVEEDAPGALDTPEGRGESILVVEGDPVLRDLNTRLLTDAGYVVTAAAGLTEALSALNQTKFDLLWIAIILPDGNGLDVARKARSRAKDIPILLCSGYALDSETHESIQGEGYRYLEKPVGTMQLLQTAREMLDE